MKKRWTPAIVLAVSALVAAAGIAVVPPHWERARRRAEAERNLFRLFTSLKATYGEWGTYMTDLESLRWHPDGAPHFVYGFCGEFPSEIPGIAGYDATRSDTSKDSVAGDPPKYSREHTKAIGPPCEALAKLGLDPEKFRPTGQLFLAFAIGNVDDDPDLEVWTIDVTKDLVRLVPD